MDAAKPDVSSIDHFLKTVERRALRMAEMATSNRDEAMDLVQDAMFGFVRHYAAQTRRRLGAAVLSRARQPHQRLAPPPHRARTLAGGVDEVAATTKTASTRSRRRRIRTIRVHCCVWPAPKHRMALDEALKKLPTRQRQAFLLRVWEGFDVATTANVMRCSEGSVKTHLSRALAALRRALESYA